MNRLVVRDERYKTDAYNPAVSRIPLLARPPPPAAVRPGNVKFLTLLYYLFYNHNSTSKIFDKYLIILAGRNIPKT
jgi:hypothetical protein